MQDEEIEERNLADVIYDFHRNLLGFDLTIEVLLAYIFIIVLNIIIGLLTIS
ncbi:hypothetical protein [Paenibacillus odorifer]|uniref:hypothetical protein n=1 Tax=Paenibacillus odorifer TaxID=189426 RepID=UPI0015C3C232|nr:hypothetical protein [Paenibacillus odorifer]